MNREITHYIFDVNKQKYYFPERRFLIKYLFLISGRTPRTEEGIVRYVETLENQEGTFVVLIFSDGDSLEVKLSDYIDEVVNEFREEKCLIEEG